MLGVIEIRGVPLRPSLNFAFFGFWHTPDRNETKISQNFIFFTHLFLVGRGHSSASFLLSSSSSSPSTDDFVQDSLSSIKRAVVSSFEDPPDLRCITSSFRRYCGNEKLRISAKTTKSAPHRNGGPGTGP